MTTTTRGRPRPKGRLRSDATVHVEIEVPPVLRQVFEECVRAQGRRTTKKVSVAVEMRRAMREHLDECESQKT